MWDASGSGGTTCTMAIHDKKVFPFFAEAEPAQKQGLIGHAICIPTLLDVFLSVSQYYYSYFVRCVESKREDLLHRPLSYAYALLMSN